MTPIWLDSVSAAVYAGVRPATLRVWAHRYRLTVQRAPDGSSRYRLDELAEVLARRAQGDTPPLLDNLL